MRDINVAIADDNETMVDLLSNLIECEKGLNLVGTAKDGVETLEIIKDKEPDVVLLDMIMPRLDGLGVLEQVKEDTKLKKQPAFIVISAVGHEAITASAFRNGAVYFIIKPFENGAVIRKIREVGEPVVKGTATDRTQRSKMRSTMANPNLHTTQSASDTRNTANEAMHPTYNLTGNIETDVTKVLHDVEVPAHIKGYQFLRDAIIMAVDDSEVIGSITKVLYPNIAEKNNTTPSCVERAIRNAINAAWKRGDAETLNNMFGYTINAGKRKPTNSEFIALISDKLRLEYVRM